MPANHTGRRLIRFLAIESTLRLTSVPGLAGSLRILLRLMSRISIDGIEQSCDKRCQCGNRMPRNQVWTDNSRKGREQVDPDVEILEAAAELDEVWREVFEQVVPERKLLHLVLELLDDLSRHLGDTLVAQVDRIELRPAVVGALSGCATFFGRRDRRFRVGGRRTC